MPNHKDDDDDSAMHLEIVKVIVDGMKYLGDLVVKFATIALPILYMQWSNGTKLEDIGVKADRAVANAETAAEKAEESAKAIKEKMG